jgi:hypothetical protein
MNEPPIGNRLKNGDQVLNEQFLLLEQRPEQSHEQLVP